MFSMPGLTVINVLESPIFFVATGTAASISSLAAGDFFCAQDGFVLLVVFGTLVGPVFDLGGLLLTTFLITGAAVVMGGLTGAGATGGAGDLRSG